MGDLLVHADAGAWKPESGGDRVANTHGERTCGIAVRPTTGIVASTCGGADLFAGCQQAICRVPTE
ncbi:MAG: hypothetical protein J2P44_02555 [Candidatus Dormibacteraeota bacterium]|nr:hypothetical protein [Candidatus Dormibacteraeota bacterium]